MQTEQTVIMEFKTRFAQKKKKKMKISKIGKRDNGFVITKGSSV